jgi:hypothetical protein
VWRRCSAKLFPSYAFSVLGGSSCSFDERRCCVSIATQRHGPHDPRHYVPYGFIPGDVLVGTSEKQLQTKLYQPRIAHLLRLPKRRARVSGVTINAVELSVVKQVENLCPEFHT